MTYLLHYVNPSLWKGQNDQRSAIHACTVNIVLNLTNLEEGKGKYHDIVLNLISYEGWEGRGEGGGGNKDDPNPTYILRYNFTHSNFMKLLLVFYNSRLESRRFTKNLFWLF